MYANSDPDSNGIKKSSSEDGGYSPSVVGSSCAHRRHCISGGVGGALLVAEAAMLFLRSRKQEVTQAVPVQSIKVSDLKALLADEVAISFCC